MKTRKILSALVSIVLVMILSQREAFAVADGNGVCSAEEITNHDCVNLGPGNTFEYLSATDSNQCITHSVPTTAECTAFFYKYAGLATNQVNFAIPADVTQIMHNAVAVNCFQFYVNGAGDPTTGFGKGISSLNICRTAQNLANSPPDIIPPSLANVVIYADRSTVGTDSAVDIQLKKGNNIYSGRLTGPKIRPPQVYEPEATLTSSNGTSSISYRIDAGTPVITNGSGRVVPRGGTKLCIVNQNGDKNIPYTDLAFSSNWTCETITYATEQCDIKTDGGDPCRMIGGICVKY